MAPANSAASLPESRNKRAPSKRFLAADEVRPSSPGRCRAWGPGELFAEGQWQVIRVQLEQQGWYPSQIELVHDQLRQGWPLTTAKRHAARLSGHCPLRAQNEI
ncbi:MAG: hypothetical protein EBZ51_05760 [Synechococcaceae bacterium WB9_2_112]|jgi:hypothetical protein|nr:hypothetical protein [Synechococcaceae bacterium WB9_2_112]